MAIEKTEGLVIKTWEWGETSLIASFFSRDFGKFKGVLKGIKREPRKFSSSLEPFSRNEIVFYHKTRTELHLVSECYEKERFPALREVPRKTVAASYAMELVDCLFAFEDAHAAVFELLCEFLDKLGREADPEPLLFGAQIKLLNLSGFQPHLRSCLSCRKEVRGTCFFSPRLGGILCRDCQQQDRAATSLLAGTLASILHIEKTPMGKLQLGFDPRVRTQLKLLLSQFLVFHLPQQPRSHRVLESMPIV